MRATVVDPRGRGSARPDAALLVPKPPLPGPLGLLASRIYQSVVSRRNARFDRGERVERMPVPVISVGNLSVGGTGKTPMVMWAVRALHTRAVHAAIAMRGYGATRDARSDEHEEYLERLWDLRTPVVADPKRAEAIRGLLVRDPTVQAVVLDDGFQHRFVARNADLVLIDATRDPFHDRCLPAGWLREPVASLSRAHAVILTRVHAVPERDIRALKDNIARINPRAPVAGAYTEWESIETPTGARAPDALNGKRIHVVCAIGNPGAFVAQARAHGAIINSIDALRDHARYSPAWTQTMLERARDRRCDIVLTTGKDWVKLRAAMPPEAPADAPTPHSARPHTPLPQVWRPRAAISWAWGESEILGLLERACVRQG